MEGTPIVSILDGYGHILWLAMPWWWKHLNHELNIKLKENWFQVKEKPMSKEQLREARNGR